MTMEKRNVLEDNRTPVKELEVEKQQLDWSKEATDMFHEPAKLTGKKHSKKK